MAGTPLAEAFVRVRAVPYRFKEDIRDGLKGAGDDFGKQFSREASARLRAERAQFASAGDDMGGAAGDAAGEQFGRRMAEEGAVRFGDDGAPFVSVGRKLGDESGAAAGEAFGRRFSQDANGRWHDERGRFVAEGAGLGEAAGDGFKEGFNRRASEGARDHGRRAGKDFGDGAGDGLRDALRGLAPAFESVAAAAGKVLGTAGIWGGIAAGVAGLGAAAASSAGYVVALAGEIAPLAGLLAALPGVALVGAAAFTSWKLATGGLGEAMKQALAGNDKALAAALDRLSEGGRELVAEFQAAIPALRDFKSAAQDAFTDQLAGSLAGFISALDGLKPSISGLATELGAIVRQALEFATSAQSITSFNTVLGNTSTLMGGLRAALDPLLRGFVDLGTVGSSWLAGLSGGLTENLTKFGAWMSQVAESGQAWAWMDNALVVLKALGGIAKDVGDILTGVLQAGRDAGTGALGVLGQLVSKFNEWVNSAKGQEVLVTVFKALDEVGRALTPVLGALGGAVAAIAPEVAKIATALGPVLADAIGVLGKGIAALGPGLVKMVESFGRMVDAIGPLEPLGSAIGDIFAALGEALVLIVPQLADIALALAPALANAIKALGPALAQLGPGLVAIAENLAKAFASEEMQRGLLALGKGLSDVLIAVAPLLPTIGQLAGILAQVLGGALTNLGVALGPIIKSLAEALGPALNGISDALNLLIPLMEPIYKAFGDIGAALITELLPPILNLIPTMIDSLIPAFTQLATEIKPLIPLLADLAVKFIKEILPALLPMLPELSKMSLEFTRMGLVLAQLVADVAPYIEQIIGIFQHLYDTLVGHSIIPDLINGITKWFRDGVQWVKDIVSWFGDLPGIMAAWLGQVVDWVENKWNLIKNYIGMKIDEIKTKVSGTLDTIKQKWSDIWDGLKTFVSDKWNEIKTAVSGKVDDMLETIRGIPRRITSALGNLGSLLWDSGRSIVQGLIDGLWSKLQDAANAARDILQRIRDFFPHSPAKVGPFSGKGWVLYSGESMMTALADGIRGQAGVFTGALDGVMRAGAAALAPGFQVPALAAVGGSVAASVPVLPDFRDSFTAPAVTAPGPAARSVNVENLVVNVQGIIDPNNPMSARRFAEAIRQQIRDLEREQYA